MEEVKATTKPWTTMDLRSKAIYIVKATIMICSLSVLYRNVFVEDMEYETLPMPK